MKELNLDKSKWIKVKLGELADDITEREDNPSQSKYERFVGLDHFVSGELKIKQWAITDNLVSAAKVFKTGDVLFARRNAYLRRASIVDFDGLCSGDAFVLRENHKKIIPGFLTFILNSEKLWNYANANAAGTMSKRVKWRDLGNYELLIPPKVQQSYLAELLWTSDALNESYIKLEIHQKEAGSVNLIERFNTLFSNSKNQVSALGNVGKWHSGGTPSKKDKLNWEKGTICWVSPKDAKAEEINTSEDKITEIALGTSSLRLHSKGSFCIVWRSGILQHSLPIIKVNCPFTINQDMKTFEPINDHIKSEYVRIFLLVFKEKIRQKIVKEGTTVQSISTDSFLKWNIPVPEINIQEEIIRTFNIIKQSESQIINCRVKSKMIQKQLINQIFAT